MKNNLPPRSNSYAYYARRYGITYYEAKHAHQLRFVNLDDPRAVLDVLSERTRGRSSSLKTLRSIVRGLESGAPTGITTNVTLKPRPSQAEMLKRLRAIGERQRALVNWSSQQLLDEIIFRFEHEEPLATDEEIQELLEAGEIDAAGAEQWRRECDHIRERERGSQVALTLSQLVAGE